MARLLVLCSLFIVGVPFVSSAGLPKHLTKAERINAPPSGKALVNFHRPSNWGGGEKFAIFGKDGKMLIDLPGGSEFQYVCDPGEQVFIAWADHVTVIKAEVAADKIYDVMIDIGMGWVRGNIQLIPLAKGDDRRSKLADYEKREKKVVALNRNKHVTDYEEKNQDRIEQIKKDFFGGDKSDRAVKLGKDDCR
jgi:hypothetical protein